MRLLIFIALLWAAPTWAATCIEFWTDPSLVIDDNQACLTWAIPTQNADGSPITDLAKYTIYYGTNPANLMQSTTKIEITDPASDGYELLLNVTEPTTYYFVITASDIEGNESAPSEMVNKVIRFVDIIGPNPPGQFRIQMRIKIPVPGGELVHP